MPTSRKTYPLSAAYIEALHDTGIFLNWPGIEPVTVFDCLDLNLLESAAMQPFAGAFNVEFYPTVYDKAACLFFSIAGGHIFSNGNKRTAVLALDQFLLANSIYLLLSNTEIRKLAESTAQYRVRNEHARYVQQCISTLIRENSTEFRHIQKRNKKLYLRCHKVKRLIRTAPMNLPGVRPLQAIAQGR